MLDATHAGLRRLRLMRRQRETLRTTARGRKLLADPDALVVALHEDLCGGEGFEADAWVLIEEALHDKGPLPGDELASLLATMLGMEGWRDADGSAIEGASLLWALQSPLCRAEGYGLLRRSPRAEPLVFELTAAFVFDADLLNARGVRARLAVLERQPLTALHDAIQQAFGWWDDHLYSFWLDGSLVGDDDLEFTTPGMADAGVATADVPIAELGLSVGQRIGYVFDFGDDWRVRLTVRERTAAAAGDHPRVLELRGTPPPQYAEIDD